MYLNDDLREVALCNGVGYFGVSDLTKVQNVIKDQGGDEVTDYPFCITLGITLMNTIVDRLPNRDKYSVRLNYKLHAYEIINNRLDMIASLLSSIIQQRGYNALPIPAAERIDNEKICASFSHKLGASLSGLGWIGKSCLLITPENGPRVRWISILTDAPLLVTGERISQKCGNCNLCVDICPVNAFTGQNFQEGEPREVRYDAKRCEDYFEEMKKNGEVAICGLCLYVCPHGRK